MTNSLLLHFPNLNENREIALFYKINVIFIKVTLKIIVHEFTSKILWHPLLSPSFFLNFVNIYGCVRRLDDLNKCV